MKNRQGLKKTDQFINGAERWSRRIGIGTLAAALTILLGGVWRSTRRPVGRTVGQEPGVMRQPLFFLLASAGYFGLCYRLWRPLAPTLSLLLRVLTLPLGIFLYFVGLAFVLSGRLTLGRMYNVSSSFGAQLYTDQQLITHGPFAYVRHPMYLGILLVGWGGLLLYRTWTFVFIIAHFPGLLVRAHHEEQALAIEFGEQWKVYSQRVPAWLPRFFREAG